MQKKEIKPKKWRKGQKTGNGVFMAILKTKKIREMENKEIDEKLKELRLELSKEMASSEVGGSVKSPGRIREIRKTIARILTIKHMKEIKKKKG
jgi:large subunit ribosomal protein L29